MPEQVADVGQLAALLKQRASEGADSARIACIIVDAWTHIDAALTPIVGRRGVATLHQRSRFTAAAQHPWLSDASEGLPQAMDVEALRALLGKQSPAEVALAGGALLQEFQDLLATLVGSPLTERLLRSVWANSLCGPAAAKDSQP
jgi:hypothetical protein